MKNQSYKIAICGIIIALSIIIMALTFLPNLTYSLPAIAGALLVIIVIEVGIKYAFVSYLAVSILSVILAPDKFSVLLYISFFGYYPILKALYEKTKNKYISWFYKFVNFNFSVTVCGLVSSLFLDIDIYKLINGTLIIGLFLVGNAVFIIYDLAINNIVGIYLSKLRK